MAQSSSRQGRTPPFACRHASVLLLSVLTACGSKHSLSIGFQAQATDAASDASDANDTADAATHSEFRLLFRDDFDSLDAARWDVARHTFEKNLADFSADNVSIENSILKIAVRKKPEPDATENAKPYTAAAVRTWQEFTYGRFVTSARLAQAPGVISAFFGFHDFYRYDSPVPNWNEIVIEATEPARYRFTCSHESRLVADQKEAHATSGVLPFPATDEFHVYAFEWTPSAIRMFIDGEEQTHSCNVPELLNLGQRIVMSAYPTTATWAGTFDPSVLPVQAEFDWIELHEYVGDDGG